MNKFSLSLGILIIITLSACSSSKNTMYEKKEELKTSKSAKTNTKVQVNSSDFITQNALHDAVRASDLELVKFIISKGVNINLQDQYGFTPIHLAVRLHDYNITDYLIQQEANLNTVDYYNDTPLLDSTRNNDTNISRELICNGANRNVLDIHQMSTLHYASKNHNQYISDLLTSDNLRESCFGKLDIAIDVIDDPLDDNKPRICGEILNKYIVSGDLNIKGMKKDSNQSYPITVYPDTQTWCSDVSVPLKNDTYAFEVTGYDKFKYSAKDKTSSTVLVIPNLGINIEQSNADLVDNTPMFCGEITKGDIVTGDLYVSDTRSKDTYLYPIKINQEEKTWCSNVNDELKNSLYEVSVIGYDEDKNKVVDTTEARIKKMYLGINIEKNSKNINDNTPKFCGEITNGNIIKGNLNVSGIENTSNYTYPILINQNNKTWCSNVNDELENGLYNVQVNGFDNNDNNASDTTNAKIFIIPGLYDALMTEFRDDFGPWGASLEKDTLIFRFANTSVLFKRGSSVLRKSYQDILDDFFPRYVNIVTQYKKDISYISIEGHASSEHSRGKTFEDKFELNRILSQKRADRVLQYSLRIKNQYLNENNSLWTKDTFNAKGLSSSILILNADQSENKKLSRRVEFRIQSTNN